MCPFLPINHQYQFSPLDTSQLVIKTDDTEMFDWSDEPISPTPLYYGPFHDAMVDINRELDLGFQKIEEKQMEEISEKVIVNTVALKEIFIPKLKTKEEMLKRDEKLSIKLEPLLQHHRTLRKRSSIGINYNEDQRVRRLSMTPSPATSVNSPSTTTSSSSTTIAKCKRNSLRISTSRAISLSSSSSSSSSSSFSSSPIPSAGLPDRFSACLLCRKRKIKCVPFRDSHEYKIDGTNNGKCGTCIRRGKECSWPKINVSRSTLSSCRSASISPSTVSTPTSASTMPAQTSNCDKKFKETLDEEKKASVQVKEESTVQDDEEEKEMLEEIKVIHETPIRLTLRAFGRSTSSIYTPILSPISPSPSLSPSLSPCGSTSLTSNFNSPSTPSWPNSPQTPLDENDCQLISVIPPLSEREYLLPTLNSSYTEMLP